MTDARNARHQLRVVTSPAGNASVVVARQGLRVVTGLAPSNTLVGARQQLRVAIDPLTPEPSVTVKVWTGSAFVDAPVKVWTGSAFVAATGVKTWNGTAWV